MVDQAKLSIATNIYFIGQKCVKMSCGSNNQILQKVNQSQVIWQIYNLFRTCFFNPFSNLNDEKIR